jgi:hypothetical protein
MGVEKHKGESLIDEDVLQFGKSFDKMHKVFQKKLKTQVKLAEDKAKEDSADLWKKD